jgi:glycosyltransferase involved in cell wall biosynthesis
MRRGQKLRVGITTFGCDSGRSGIGQYALRMIEEFANSRYPAEFEVLGHHQDHEIFGLSGIPYQSVSNFHHHPSLNILWHQFLLPRICQKRKYDLLFVVAGNRRLPYWVPCPIVGTVHDLSSFHIGGKYDLLRDWYIKKQLPSLIGNLCRAITISDSSKQDILRHSKLSENQVHVIPLAADRKRFDSREKEKAQSDAKEKYFINYPYILYISRIEHPGKNHVRLIEAFDLLKKKENIPHHLVFGGEARERSEEVFQKAAKSPFSDQIHFLNFISNRHLPALYRGADLFVFPSLYEGFGLPILEAMSCGVPVACSNISSIPEVAGEAAELFDPKNTREIANSMRSIIKNTTNRETLIRKGIMRSKQFSWSKTAEQTFGVFQEACGGKN